MSESVLKDKSYVFAIMIVKLSRFLKQNLLKVKTILFIK